MKSKTTTCPPHKYIYQMMTETRGGSLTWEVTRRILFCEKCGKVKDLKMEEGGNK